MSEQIFEKHPEYVKYAEYIEENIEDILDQIKERFESQKADLRNKLLSQIGEYLTPVPTHYEWTDEAYPCDRSGVLIEFGIVSLNQTVYDFLREEYTGERIATHSSGEGWRYPTYGDCLTLLMRDTCHSKFFDIAKKALSEEFNAAISDEQITEICNAYVVNYDMICDEHDLLDYTMWETVVKIVGIGNMRLNQIVPNPTYPEGYLETKAAIEKYVAYINEHTKEISHFVEKEFEAGKDKMRTYFLNIIRDMLTPVPRHYVWRPENNSHDISGILVKKNKTISLKKTVDLFLQNEYSGNKIPTYERGMGFYYPRYADEIQPFTLGIAAETVNAAVKKYIENHFGTKLTPQEFHSLLLSCFGFIDIRNHCIARTFYDSQAVMKYIGISDMTLYEVLHTPINGVGPVSEIVPMPA